MWTLVNLSFFIFFLKKIPNKVSADVFYTNVDRCYVDKSNTCKDATPSNSRPGWVWSCEACTHQKKKSPESLEKTESSESSENNGKTGNLTHTYFDIHYMNE